MPKSTEVAPREATDLAVPDPLDAFQQGTKEDLVVPFRSLVQGVSRKADTRQAGQFWDEIEDTYQEQITVAIISVRRERALFDEDNLDSAPICASNDAREPRLIVVHKDRTTGPTCEECSFKNDGCQFSYGLLCYDLAHSEMFVIRVSGASRGAWRLYLTKGQKAGTAAFAVETIIGSEQKTFPKGQAYVLTFTGGDGLPKEQAAEMRQIAAEFQDVRLAAPPERDIDDDAPEPAVEPDTTPQAISIPELFNEAVLLADPKQGESEVIGVLSDAGLDETMEEVEDGIRLKADLSLGNRAKVINLLKQFISDHSNSS